MVVGVLNCCGKSSYATWQDECSKDLNPERWNTECLRSIVTWASHRQRTEEFLLTKPLPTVNSLPWHLKVTSTRSFILNQRTEILKKRNLQLQCNRHLQADSPSQNKGWPWRAVTRDLSPPWLLKMFPWSFRFLLQRNGWCKKLVMCAFVCGAARKRRPVEFLSVSATWMPFSGWRRTKYLLFCRDLGNEMLMANKPWPCILELARVFTHYNRFGLSPPFIFLSFGIFPNRRGLIWGQSRWMQSDAIKLLFSLFSYKFCSGNQGTKCFQYFLSSSNVQKPRGCTFIVFFFLFFLAQQEN